jgi:hypothetical protein
MAGKPISGSGVPGLTGKGERRVGAGVRVGVAVRVGKSWRVAVGSAGRGVLSGERAGKKSANALQALNPNINNKNTITAISLVFMAHLFGLGCLPVFYIQPEKNAPKRGVCSGLFAGVFNFACHKALRVALKGLQAGFGAKINPLSAIERRRVALGVVKASAASGFDRLGGGCGSCLHGLLTV